MTGTEDFEGLGSLERWELKIYFAHIMSYPTSRRLAERINHDRPETRRLGPPLAANNEIHAHNRLRYEPDKKRKRAKHARFVRTQAFTKRMSDQEEEDKAKHCWPIIHTKYSTKKHPQDAPPSVQRFHHNTLFAEDADLARRRGPRRLHRHRGREAQPRRFQRPEQPREQVLQENALLPDHDVLRAAVERQEDARRRPPPLAPKPLEVPSHVLRYSCNRSAHVVRAERTGL